jgi:hypothetical protein
MVAGTRRMGLGRFFGQFEGDSDGTVAVAETRLPGLAAHALIHASHSGLIVSREAADLAARFFRTGAFVEGFETPGAGGERRPMPPV